MKPEERQRDQFLWRQYLPILIVCIIGAIICYFVGPYRYGQRILLLVILWAALASSFNIISGYGGQTVFGYMMYVGTGAYTTVILFKFLGISPWLGMGAGIIVAALVAFAVGLPTLYLHGAYFAMATIAFPSITVPILNYLGLEEQSIPFTGHGIGSMQFTDIRMYVLISLVFFGVVHLLIRKMELSRFGYALNALKQNETAAEGLGIDTYWTKMIAFLFSAALGSVLGTVYAFSVQYVLTTGSVFGVFIIVRILSIGVVGGLGTLWGPAIAAAVLVPIGEILNAQFGSQYPGVQDVVYGAALIAAIIYMPEGIWIKIRGWFHPRKPAPVAMEEPVKDAADQYRLGLEYVTPVKLAAGDDPILRIEGVHKFFGGVVALKDVQIEVSRGKVLGVIGPNGSGKTTLFNVVNGYLTPEKGSVFFEGVDITHLKPHDVCRLGIGRTFQIPQVLGKMSILENIMMGAFAKSASVNGARAFAEQIAGQMGLARRANDPAVGLTMWEIKMLEFSRALATEPKLLLVDEPMAGLNPEESNRIGEIIKAIAESGVTVIVIEHVVQSLVKIADRMVGLENGEKVAEGLPQEVISDPHIIEAYLGAKWRGRHAESYTSNNRV